MAYVRTRIGRWFYEERGAPRRSNDPAIVLLHGLLFDGGMWSGQLEALSALGRVVVIDGPGHGKSRELPPPFTLEDHADAMTDALSELRIPSAIFVGLSWGGMVSMRLALQHPQRVRALALLDTSADAEDRAKAVKYRVLVSFARRFGLPTWLVNREIGPILFGAATLRDRPELVEQFARRVNGYPRDGLARATKAVVVKRTSITAKLGGISVPTLVVCGKDDRATEPVHSETIARRIPGAKLSWIDDSGHMSAVERPEEVARVLAPFVRAQLEVS